LHKIAFFNVNVHFVREKANAVPESETLFVSPETVKSVYISVVCSEKLWGLFILIDDLLLFIMIQSNVQ